MEDEILDNRLKKMEENAKKLRKTALDAEKNLAKKISELNIKNEPTQLDIDISGIDAKYSELLKINSDAIRAIKQMGDELTDEDLITLKTLYQQNTQLLDLWTQEEEKIRKKHSDKYIKDKQDAENKIADAVTQGKEKRNS